MMDDITVTLSEEDRQLTLLALSICAVRRPGFDYALGEIAEKMERPGESLYSSFKELNMDSR